MWERINASVRTHLHGNGTSGRERWKICHGLFLSLSEIKYFDFISLLIFSVTTSPTSYPSNFTYRTIAVAFLFNMCIINLYECFMLLWDNGKVAAQIEVSLFLSIRISNRAQHTERVCSNLPLPPCRNFSNFFLKWQDQ